MTSDDTLMEALGAIRWLGTGPALTRRIAAIERLLVDQPRDAADELVAGEGISGATLRAALLVKALASQIDVIVHALGILVALPHILDPGEIIESLSLGAGNTGRQHDLETDRRIAEFKFIDWKGGAESIRQNVLFIDLFNLATADTEKQRVLYVVGKDIPLLFLQRRRSIDSVLSKNSAVATRFRDLHGEEFVTVNDYFVTVQDRVEIVDLRDMMDEFAAPVPPPSSTASQASQETRTRDS